MSIIQVKGKGGGIATERTLFVGPRIPNEIKAMSKLLASCDQATFRKLLQVLVKDFEGKDIDGCIMDDLVTDTVNEEALAIMYSGLYKLLKLALRIPAANLKQQIFSDDLNDLRVPEQFIADITSAVFGSRRPHIDAHSIEEQPHLPKLDSFRWRVDVAISTSALSRVIAPSVMMEMELSDGTRQQFEVGVSQECWYNEDLFETIRKQRKHLQGFYHSKYFKPSGYEVLDELSTRSIFSASHF